MVALMCAACSTRCELSLLEADDTHSLTLYELYEQQRKPKTKICVAKTEVLAQRTSPQFKLAIQSSELLKVPINFTRLNGSMEHLQWQSWLLRISNRPVVREFSGFSAKSVCTDWVAI